MESALGECRQAARRETRRMPELLADGAASKPEQIMCDDKN